MLQKENPKKEKSEGRDSGNLIYTTFYLTCFSVINVKCYVPISKIVCTSYQYLCSLILHFMNIEVNKMN